MPVHAWKKFTAVAPQALELGKAKGAAGAQRAQQAAEQRAAAAEAAAEAARLEAAEMQVGLRV
jgi:hypothetical protein